MVPFARKPATNARRRWFSLIANRIVDLVPYPLVKVTVFGKRFGSGYYERIKEKNNYAGHIVFYGAY